MNSILHPPVAARRQVILSVIGLLLAATQVVAQNKVVTANPSFKADPPVTIRQISFAGKPLELGVPFAADDSWLDDLSVEFENTSGRSIVYIEVMLSFAHVREDGPRLSAPLTFGQVPGAPSATGTTETLAPGARATVALGSKAGEVRRALGDGQHQSDRVNVRIATVLFADGTLWRNGFTGRPDSEHKSRWNMQSRAAGANVAGGGRAVRYVAARYTASRLYCYEYQNSDYIPCGCGQYIFSDNVARCSPADACTALPSNEIVICTGEGACYNRQRKILAVQCS